MTTPPRPFADHLAPLRRSTYRTPPARRRLAARLARRIGIRKTAYLFSVSPRCIYRWHRQS